MNPQGKSRKKPLFWALFAGGGMGAALMLPALVFGLFLAGPREWIGPARYEDLIHLLGNPLVRLVLFGLVTLSLFHAAHRIRYTLYDGLQLYHLGTVIAAATYGPALLMSGAAAWVFWSLG